MLNEPDKKNYEVNLTIGRISLVLITSLSAFLIWGGLRQEKLQGAGANSQAEYEAAVIADIDSFEAQEVSARGKYKLKPKQNIQSEFPTTYRVNEWVKGKDEARGYTIYIETLENENVFNATTSQMETVQVKKIKTIER